MQYSNSEIKSALHQNGGDLAKTLRFLNLYHEELAGVKKEGPETDWTFSEEIPPDFAETWTVFYQVPFIKELLKPFVVNETIYVARLKQGFELDNLHEFPKEIRSQYLKYLVTDIVLEKTLGYGAFGDVYLAKGPNSPIEYAAKLFYADKKESYQQETKILSFVNEMDIVTQKSQNRNVVGWFGSFDSLDLKRAEGTPIDDSIVILTEFVEGVTLGKTGFKAWERWAHYPYIVWQLFSGLAFLHAKEVAHGDIKLDNLMLQPATAESDGRLVIIDLGLACVFDDPKGLETFKCADLPRAGSEAYFSPQKARVFSYQRDESQNKNLEEKADLWAAALTIVCFLTDLPPKVALHNCLGMDEFKEGIYTFVTLGPLSKYEEDEEKLKGIQKDVWRYLQFFYLEKIGPKSKEKTFEQNCEHIWKNLGHIFSNYKDLTAEDILRHLNINDSQELFSPAGNVKPGAGVF